MDNQSPLDTTPISPDPSSNQQPNSVPTLVAKPQTSTSELNDTKNSVEPIKINAALLAFLVTTFCIPLVIGESIISKIQSGILRYEVQTGWIIVWYILLVPVLILLFFSAAISFTIIRRSRKKGISTRKTVKLAALITAGLVIASLVISFGMSKYDDYTSRDRRAQAQQIIQANKDEGITINYATELLNSCKLRKVYNGTNDTYAIGTEVRNSREGVVLIKGSGNPYLIWVTDKANSVLMPAIDNAKKNCPNFST